MWRNWTVFTELAYIKVIFEPLSQRVPARHYVGAGGAFFLLALFAGVLGGVLGLPFLHVQASQGVVASHALLMSFYVVCPAFLGGMAHWFLPGLLGVEAMAFPAFSRMGFVLLLGGVLLLPVMPMVGLSLWAVGMIALAVNNLATILEVRRFSFRALSPLVWSFIGSALSVLVVAPVLLALLVQNILHGIGLVALLATLRGSVEMTLLSVPSVGIIVAFLLPEAARGGWVARLAPYVFGAMGVLPVLLWADYLFKGVSPAVYGAGLFLGLVLPCMTLLCGFVVDLWRGSFAFKATSYWASGALVLLLAGWSGEFAAPLLQHLMVLPAFFTFGGAGHQLAMFGSLLALSCAFYGWCCACFSHYERHLHIFAALHAGVTFVGALCSVVPSFSLFAALFMGMSLLMFALPSGMMWYGFLVERVRVTRSLVKE